MADRRVVIVTGSTSGIGWAIARRCIDSGWATVVNSRVSADTGRQLVAGIEHATYIQGDVSQEADCAAIVAAAVERWGRVDALVNNAATTALIPHEDVAAVDAALWRQILDVNIVGPWQMISAALAANVASVAGLRPLGSSLPYAVSKAGLIHMTALLAKALGPDVLVNAIAPGLIDTPWTADWAQVREVVRQQAPLRRSGQPEDVAQVCDWLLNARYVTGECVSVDGGLRLVT